VPREFGFAGLEPGDRVGGGANDLGEQQLAELDAEGGVGFLDGDRVAGVTDTDLDLLPGDADAATGADLAVHAERPGGRQRGGAAGPASGIWAIWAGVRGFGRLRSRVRSVSSRCSTR
jgi:hypothetical protein